MLLQVLYSDGDKETLLLRNERFELIGGAGKVGGYCEKALLVFLLPVISLTGV